MSNIQELVDQVQSLRDGVDDLTTELKHLRLELESQRKTQKKRQDGPAWLVFVAIAATVAAYGFLISQIVKLG